MWVELWKKSLIVGKGGYILMSVATGPRPKTGTQKIPALITKKGTDEQSGLF
jgi:hypothetical protein